MAIADIHETLMPNHIISASSTEEKGRGLQVYTMSQLLGITGETKDGQRLTGNYEQPIFYLTIEERVSIFRLCAPVTSVVSSRMQRIAGLEWTIVSDKSQEDKLYERLKSLKQICDEYISCTDLAYVIARGKILQEIKNTLPDVLPDLSNFNSALLRWKKRINSQKTDDAERIQDWCMQPNINTKFPDLIKQNVFDLMVHGSCSVYKEILDNRVENVYALPGGTVLPLKNMFVGGVQGYVQIVIGLSPQIFFGDELAYATYIPTTARNYGFIPLEALINKVCESLLFDKLMAEQADGTKPPEKMVIVANPSPFGAIDREFELPISDDEQARIETKINTPKKNAIMTFTGNHVEVIDLSRENTMPIQMQRQKDIREEVGMVFQATPMEMSLAGGDNTSGRSTSEEQGDIYMSSGVLPIVQIIKTLWDYDILPYREGPGYKLKFTLEPTDKEKMEKLKAKRETGVYSVNEIRVNDLNEDPFPDKKFDLPDGGSQTEINPNSSGLI